MFRTGDQIGPYKLTRSLGSGGFGDVWLGEKAGLVTTQFALKLPRAGELDAEVFESEARIWVEATGHTNVVPLIEADRHPVTRDGDILVRDQIVITSEYLSDGSLADLLNRSPNKTLASDDLVDLMRGILSGLSFLHSRSPAILHRDLKPENVLMQGGTPRLTDFGISRALRSESYLHTARISGTLPYMAPEVFKGQFSVRTDIWAAGVVLYQMIAGRLPFYHAEIPALIASIMQDPLPPLPGTVDGSVASVVYRALDKDPAKRFRTAHEMRDALKTGVSYFSSPTIPMSDPTIPRFLEEPVKPKPWARAFASATIGILLVAGVLGSAVFYWTRPDNKVAVEPQPTATPAPPVITPTLSPTSVVDITSIPPLDAFTGADTSDEPIMLPPSTGSIIQWRAEPGELINPCRNGSYSIPVVKYSYYIQVPGGVEGSGRKPYDINNETDYFVTRPVILKEIILPSGSQFYSDKKVGTIGNVTHIWAEASIDPKYREALIPGTTVEFTVTATKRKFRGTLITADSLTNKIRVALNDQEVFDQKALNCLLLGINVKGKLTFIPPGK